MSQITQSTAVESSPAKALNAPSIRQGQRKSHELVEDDSPKTPPKDPFQRKLFELKKIAPCDYQYEHMARDLWKVKERDDDIKAMGLETVLIPGLEGDGMHKGLVNQMISFNQSYKKHVGEIKQQT